MSRDFAASLGYRAAGAAQRRAKKQGNAFEDTLDDLHALYAQRGEAVVVRSPAPIRILAYEQGGVVRGRLEGIGPVDYTGLVAGRGVAFDAKSTTAETWRLDALEVHQAAFLDQWAAQGGFGFVLLWLRGPVWLLPWTTLRPLWISHRAGRIAGTRAAPGTASLTEAHLVEIGHRCQGAAWLPALRRAWGTP